MKIFAVLHLSFITLVNTYTVSSLSNPISPSTTNTNSTTLSASTITCYGPDDVRVPITVAKCRSLLNFFRTLPQYRLVQDFMIGRYPRLPGRPPYTWWNETTTCAIRISAPGPYVVQKFSFAQARSLAIDILEYCQDDGGYGGYAPIGVPVLGFDGFSIRAIGAVIRPYPPTGNGTEDFFGENTMANKTIADTMWLDTS